MKTLAKIKMLSTLFTLSFSFGTCLLAQSPIVSVTPSQNSPAAPPAQRKIVVSLEDRRLALLENGDVKKTYPVAVGKPSTPSPVGTFSIERRVANPTYSHNGQLVEPGPRNPVGTRWMGLNVRGYGIHGTNAPKSIGKAASHGCIRMGKADLEELFDLVRAGDEVEIVGQRNEETALLFSPLAMPTAPSADTRSAQSITPAFASPAVNDRTDAGQTAQSSDPIPSRQ